MQELRGTRVGTVLLAILGVALTARYAWVTWLARASWDARRPYDNLVMTDFRDTVMLPWRMIQAGQNPYDLTAHEAMFPYAQEFNPYAPWWLSATQPLASLGWDRATLVFSIALALATSLAAFASGWWLSRRAGQWHGLEVPPATAGCLMVVLSWVWRSTSIGMGLGNIGAFASLCAALALLAPRTGWRAIFLALAWVKPQYGIPLVVVLVVSRRWLSAIAGTTMAALASLPMVFKLSALAGGFGPLVRSVLSQTGQVGVGAGDEALKGRVDLGLWFAMLGCSPAVGILLGLAIGALFAAVAWRIRRGGRPGAALMLASMGVIVSLFHLHYDLTMLLPGLVWAALEHVDKARQRTRRWVDLLAVSIALIAFVGFFPGGLLLPGAMFNWAQAVLLPLSATAALGWAVIGLRQGTLSASDQERPSLPRRALT